MAFQFRILIALGLMATSALNAGAQTASSPTMPPIQDEAEPVRPKVIRIRPPKPPPPPADESPTTPAPVATPEAVPETRPMPPVLQKRTRPAVVTAPAAATDATAPADATTDVATGDENYEYCNRTSFAINVAVGVRDDAQWRTRGWWTIYPGDCKPIIKGRLMPTAYFTFARTHFVHQGPTRVWGGNHMLCVGRGQFQASSDGTGVCGPGLEAHGFARIETAGRPSWKTTLIESNVLKNVATARVAGVQRLLADLGLYDGTVDGENGQKYRDSITAARERFSYPAEEDVMQTYQKLLAEAAKMQAQVGLTFCNRSPTALWVALGQSIQSRKQARGWWRIQAGQCEKVIKDRLAARYLFAHASNDKGGGDGVWGGSYPFCTKDAVFEMDGDDACEKRGGERTGFFAIDTQGRPGAVYNFGPLTASKPGAQ